MRQVAGSFLFALIFYPMTAILSAAGIAAGLVGRAPTLRVVGLWLSIHRWLAKHLLGIETRVDGSIPSGAFLIAVKHEAMYETMEATRVAGLPVIVLKRELDRLPLFGAVTRAYGSIPVERSAGAKALKALVKDGRKATAGGRSVLIFPEGTRVPVGATPPLRSGFTALYRALGLPVLPVAVDSGRLWGRGLVKRPGVVTFKIGEPIPPGLDRQQIEDRVHAAINALVLPAQPRT
jgi:1-acyl-sn-glycerol-3-phosphate acyltransferase